VRPQVGSGQPLLQRKLHKQFEQAIQMEMIVSFLMPHHDVNQLKIFYLLFSFFPVLHCHINLKSDLVQELNIKAYSIELQLQFSLGT